jgi:hypothetical protein
MQAPRERRCIAPAHFVLGTRWGRVVRVTFWPHFTSGKTPGTHWIGGWVGLRAVLDTKARRKSFASAGNQTPAVHFVVRLYTD